MSRLHFSLQRGRSFLRRWGWAAYRSGWGWWIFPGLQAVAVLLVVCLLPRNLLVASPSSDVVTTFLSSRAFAAAGLRAGHLPLWNPFVYGGQPFLGGFESALLYPPTLIFVWLPLDRAMNLTLLGHLLVLGWGMHYWAARRGLHPVAAAFACLGLQLCGPVFPQLYAGHLSNLCTMAWTPWLFAFLDDWRHRPRPGAWLLAAAAVCLQVLGGHIQYAFYTGIAAGLAAVLHTAWRPARWRRELPALAGVYAAGALLAAAQLLPGWEAAGEGVRLGLENVAFAGTFSFPPENLLTLAAPGFFGNLTTHLYWGRWYLWETSLFAGATGVVLVAVAAGDRRWRRPAWRWLGLVALLGVLALGSYTPLFRLLYEGVPLFGTFRGTSKFTFQAMMGFMLVLAMGVDALCRGRLPPRGVVRGVLAGGLLAGGAALAAMAHPAWFEGLPTRVLATRESFYPARLTDPAFRAQAARAAAWSLLQAGGLLLLAGGALRAAGRQPGWRWLPLAVLPLEWAGFASLHFATCRLDRAAPASEKQFLAAHPGDYRLLDVVRPNNGFLLGAPGAWGNNPGVLRRYAEFMTATQGGDPRKASQYVAFRTLPEVYAMLRVGFAVLQSPSGLDVQPGAPPMPRVQLVSGCAVLGQPGELLAALRQDFFDPRRTVYLETPPVPWPDPGAPPGRARVLESTPDSLTVEAETAAPALLLNTDVYSRGWHVRALPGSAQTHYELLPADYILRAVPLQPGHHLLRLEYRPASLTTGFVLSGTAWLGWWVLAGWCRWQRSRRRPAATGSPDDENLSPEA